MSNRKRQREEEGDHSSDEYDVVISSQSSDAGIAEDVLANGLLDSQQNRRPRHSTRPNKRRNTTPADGEAPAIRKLIYGEVPIQQFRINFPPFAYIRKALTLPLGYWRRPVSAPAELSIDGSQQVQEEEQEEEGDRTKPDGDEGKDTVHRDDIEDPQSHNWNRDFVVVDPVVESPQRDNVSLMDNRGRAGKILDEMPPLTGSSSTMFTDDPSKLSTLERLSSNVLTGIPQTDNVSAMDTCGIAREKKEMSRSDSRPSINLYPPSFTEEPCESSVLLSQSPPNLIAVDPDTDSNSFSDEENSESASESSQISLRLDESVEEPQVLVRKEKNPPPSEGYPAAKDEFLYIEEQTEPPFRRQGELVVWNALGKPATGRLLWDTGSDYEFMSFRKAFQLNLEPAPLSEQDMVRLVSTLANGQIFYPTHFLTLTIQITYLDLPQISAKHKVSFLVVNSSYDFVFGKRYMDLHKVHTAVRREAEENAQAHNAKAWVLIATRATLEEVKQNSRLREARRLRAIAVEKNILARNGHVDGGGADVMGTSTCQAGPCEIPAAPAELNFPPGFGRSFGSTTPPQAHNSRKESFGASTVSSDSIHRSFASSTTGRSSELSPATTMSSRSVSDTEIIASPVHRTKKLATRFKRGLRLNNNAGEGPG